MPLPFTDQADRDLAACVDMMRGGSKTFFAASRLLPRRLRDASREAGMAEVATGVLHNVGNVLDSVNVSATLLQENITKSKEISYRLHYFFNSTK